MPIDTDPDAGSESARRLLAPFFRKYLQRLLLGLVALLGVDFLQLSIPRVIKRAVDGLEQSIVSRNDLLVYGAVILLLALGIAVLRFAWRYSLLGFSRLLERDLRDRFFDHLLTLDRSYFQRHTSGEIMALATNDLTAVQMACGMGLVALVDALVMTVAALGFMAYIHPRLTLIAVAPMPVLALLTKQLSRRLHRRFKQVQERFSTLTELARTTIGAMRLIKSYTQEGAQSHRFDRLGQSYVRDNLRLAVIQGVLFPISGLVGNLSLLLVLYFGGRLTISGAITVGDFAAFIAYLFMLTWPMMALGWVTTLFQRGRTSLGRIQAVLDARAALIEPTVPLPPPAAPYTFSTRHLTFRYPGHDEPVLIDFSADFPPGVTGIVGRTGSGKSSLCHLLTRLYPLPDGSLFLNHTDCNRLSLAAVRNLIAYVPQEPSLFSDTIAANIAMGAPDADENAIVRAARAAAIDEEIAAMPEGYQTRIGEKGVRLSGGQRQRIALARALLLDRPILVIDDALSAVDMETERTILARLTPLLAGRTSIVVSHRLAPLADADRIIVLEQGRIAASGRHRELMATSDFYRTIYRHQTSSDEAGE